MRFRVALAAVCALVGLGACGSKARDEAAVPPPPDPSVGPERLGEVSLFIPGEYLAWEVKWKGLTGVQTQLVVGEPGTLAGKRAIIVKSETLGDGLVAVFRHLRDALTTVVNVEAGGPIRSEGVVEEGRDVEEVEVEFNGSSYDAVLREKGREKRWTQVVPEGMHADDWQSAMAYLRMWRPAPGTRGYFYAQSGISFYRVEVAAVGLETVEVELGRFRCFRLDGKALKLDKQGERKPKVDPRRFRIWVSADDRHLPVKVQAETSIGKVDAELVEFKQPDGRLLIKHRH